MYHKLFSVVRSRLFLVNNIIMLLAHKFGNILISDRHHDLKRTITFYKYDLPAR